MTATIREWVSKAEGDWNVAHREFKVTDLQNYDAVCFHAQQCTEKYLKACLIKENRSFPKTHDLKYLLESILDLKSDWNRFKEDLVFLTEWSVEVRYPGLSASKETAEKCLEIADNFRIIARENLMVD